MLSRKTRLNFIIDALAFTAGIFLFSTGCILRFVLIPGSGGMHGAGHGVHASERSVTLLWGLTRHQWGSIHFWIAIAFLVLLSLHIFLHWNWIRCVVLGAPRDASGLKSAIGLAALLLLLILALSPFFSATSTITRSLLH